jgi:hypothetical protein
MKYFQCYVVVVVVVFKIRDETVVLKISVEMKVKFSKPI